jgi:hypothetical protein
MRPLAVALALVIVAWPTSSRADSIGEEDDGTDEGCVVDDVCPDTGVRCEYDRCRGEDQCPESMVECPDEEPDDACEDDASRAGLEERCVGAHHTIHCARDEKPREGSVPDCHAKAAAAGLSERCVDPDHASVYCGRAEGEGEGEAADGETADDGGCSLNRSRRAGSGVALAVFVAAAAVTGVRAWRQRSAAQRRT